MKTKQKYNKQKTQTIDETKIWEEKNHIIEEIKTHNYRRKWQTNICDKVKCACNQYKYKQKIKKMKWRSILTLHWVFVYFEFWELRQHKTKQERKNAHCYYEEEESDEERNKCNWRKMKKETKKEITF